MSIDSAAMMVSAHSVSQLVAAGKPFLVYGTAWKKEETARYVSEAVHAGFRFIDTACQPKHYNEAGVGNGWTAAAQELGLQRSDLFLQTKYTPYSGQDPNNVPYDHMAPIQEQIQQSLQVSLKNLHTDYLDSLVMHSPLDTIEQTMEAWRVMESFVDDGKVLRLGISNCYDYDKFTTIYNQARIKPSVLQNRFYAESNFDTQLRAFCKEHHIWYQSFWTLTASRNALALAEVEELAKKKNLTPQTYMFAFLMSLGYVTPLSGTRNPQHMAQDVAIMERMQGGELIFESEEELRHFAQILGMPDL
jgi:diketogulonate reductase-like aldo/keto reductase